MCVVCPRTKARARRQLVPRGGAGGVVAGKGGGAAGRFVGLVRPANQPLKVRSQLEICKTQMLSFLQRMVGVSVHMPLPLVFWLQSRVKQ